MKISIITAVHNQLEMNQVFMEFLRKNTKNSFELIVIDNASSDGSAEFFSVQPEVLLIQNQHNYSYPYCQNQGIDVATGEYLFFANNDIIVGQDWDQQLIDTLNHHQLSAVTTSGIERIQSQWATRWFKFKWRLVKAIFYDAKHKKKSILNMHRKMYGDWDAFTQQRQRRFGQDILEGFVGNVVMIKASEMDKVGRWDETIQGADFDLYLRLKQRQREIGDVKPLHIALGTFIHHFIRFTLADPNNKPVPFKDADLLRSVESKWGDVATEYLQDQA